jgi:hypothetical protein
MFAFEPTPTPLELTASERELLIQLLETVQHDLPHEIHHTHTASVREELRRKAYAVDALIAKLRGTTF